MRIPNGDRHVVVVSAPSQRHRVGGTAQAWPRRPAPTPAGAGQEAAKPAENKPDPTLTLRIGDPKLKDKVMEIGAGSHPGRSERARRIAFDRMIRRDDGEPASSTSARPTTPFPCTRSSRRSSGLSTPRTAHLAIGMEMLPVTIQPIARQVEPGALTKEEFLREVGWYVNWNFNFGYFRRIFEFAREHRLPVYALNAPARGHHQDPDEGMGRPDPRGKIALSRGRPTSTNAGPQDSDPEPYSKAPTFPLR